jgi:hypothetical protein
MKLDDYTIDNTAYLLRQLKDIYGWPALCAMPADDLLVLMQRSARETDASSSLQAIAPWLRCGLLNLLCLPARQREDQIAQIAQMTGADPENLKRALLVLDKKLQLSRAERIQISNDHERTDPDVDESASALQSRPSAVLAAALGIGLGIGLLVTYQVSSYRQSLQRQLEAKDAQARKSKATSEERKQGENRQVPASQSPPSVSAPPPPEIPRPSVPESTALPEPTPSEQPRRENSDTQTATAEIRWQGCDSADPTAGTARSGNTWWPVVGPPDALLAVQRHCRSDAFRNNDGNTQIASFPDRSVAETFARELSGDSRHPYFFYVGDPTVYD